MLALAGPAFAQSGSASNSSSAGGSSASTGSSSSSASISTGGGGSVGVVQGAVSGGSTAGGSTTSGSSSGSSSGGGSGGGSQGAATADAPAEEGANAAQDGVVSQLDLPAMGTVEDAIPASGMSSSVLIMGLAALFAVGLFVLYRKLPRARATA